MLAFLNTNSQNEGKWRTLIEEEDNDVIGIDDRTGHVTARQVVQSVHEKSGVH